MKKTLLTLAALFTISLIYGQENAGALQKILNRLEEIKTASYYSKSSSSAPGDTLAFITYQRFVNMYVDTTDKFLGANYSTSEVDNHQELNFCYDGDYTLQFDWINRNVQIDTATDNPHSRPMAPFFMIIKSLIEYAARTLDSANTELSFHEFQDSIRIDFVFKDKLVEFMWLEPFVMYHEGKMSRYEVVLGKDYLPYKFVRKMPHQSSWETCTDVWVTLFWHRVSLCQSIIILTNFPQRYV